MQRKKLTDSQRELIRMKREKADGLMAMLQQEFTASLDMIAKELGVPENELGMWRLSKDSEYLERTDKPKMTTVKGKKK